MKATVKIIMLVPVFLLAATLFYFKSLQIENQNLKKNIHLLNKTLQASRTLIKAMDGDTVELDGGERVRILGIDTAEIWERRQGKWYRSKNPDPKAVKAYEFLRSFEGQQVRLSFEKEKCDRYGRTLAHIYVIAADIDLGSELLRRSWAKRMLIKPNTRRKKDYKFLVGKHTGNKNK